MVITLTISKYLGFNHILILALFLLSYLHIVISPILWCKALGITCNSICVLCTFLYIRRMLFLVGTVRQYPSCSLKLVMCSNGEHHLMHLLYHFSEHHSYHPIYLLID
nr:MAG TPA: hypothetical protein [Caudoviricetes sp.]